MDVPALVAETIAALDAPAGPLSKEAEAFVVETDMAVLTSLVGRDRRHALSGLRKRSRNRLGEKRRQQRAEAKQRSDAIVLGVAQASVLQLSGQVAFAQGMEASRLAIPVACTFPYTASFAKGEDTLLSFLSGSFLSASASGRCHVVDAVHALIARKRTRSKRQRAWQKRTAAVNVWPQGSV